MTTANDIIADAATELGIIGEGNPLSADDAAQSLRRLNDMLNAWAEDGVDLGYFALALADTVDVPDSHLRAIRANLAIDMASMFGTRASAETVAIAAGSWRALKSAYVKTREVKLDAALTTMPSQSGGM